MPHPRRSGRSPMLVVVLFAVLAFLTWATRDQSFSLVGMLQSTVTRATPLALGALAGVLCERSGVVNIAIEGMMLFSAFMAAFAASATGASGSAWPWVFGRGPARLGPRRAVGHLQGRPDHLGHGHQLLRHGYHRIPGRVGTDQQSGPEPLGHVRQLEASRCSATSRSWGVPLRQQHLRVPDVPAPAVRHLDAVPQSLGPAGPFCGRTPPRGRHRRHQRAAHPVPLGGSRRHGCGPRRFVPSARVRWARSRRT